LGQRKNLGEKNRTREAAAQGENPEYSSPQKKSRTDQRGKQDLMQGRRKTNRNPTKKKRQSEPALTSV